MVRLGLFVGLFGAGCKTGILVGVAPAPALRPAGGVADGFEIDELEGLKKTHQNPSYYHLNYLGGTMAAGVGPGKIGSALGVFGAFFAFGSGTVSTGGIFLLFV